MKEKIRYSIATSWDDDLIIGLSKFNSKYSSSKIIELYGALPVSITGSGRAAYRVPHITKETAARHIKKAHNCGIKFNYLINAPDFKGQENNQLWIKEVKSFLGYLAEIGVDALTVTHPTLISLIHKEYPFFQLHLSVIAGVSSSEDAKKYEDMGVSVIAVSPYKVNRDFAAIKKICEAVTCNVKIYANIPCISDCPFVEEHYRFLGYSSQIGNDLEELGQDPYFAICSKEFLKNPVQLVKSPFIRPEDIKAYQEIGVDIFKLSDRAEPTEFLLKTAGAYMAQKFDGDLFELIFRGGTKFKAALSNFPAEKSPFSPIFKIRNNVLTKMNFIEKIKSLKGKKLDDFYQEVYKCSVEIMDKRLLYSYLTSLEAQ